MRTNSLPVMQMENSLIIELGAGGPERESLEEGRTGESEVGVDEARDTLKEVHEQPGDNAGKFKQLLSLA